MMDMTRSFVAADETAMVALGSALGAAAEPGLIIFLNGGLGMGKTTLSLSLIHI